MKPDLLIIDGGLSSSEWIVGTPVKTDDDRTGTVHYVYQSASWRGLIAVKMDDTGLAAVYRADQLTRTETDSD